MKRKIIGSILSFLMAVSMLVGASGCVFLQSDVGNVDSASVSVVTEDELVVIKAEKLNGSVKLLDLMRKLQTEEKLSYEIVSGMVTSINGVSNAVDFSACWMLYTSDAEMSNTEWGTVEYDGQTFGSAIVGAEALEVVEGEYYVWAYQTF